MLVKNVMSREFAHCESTDLVLEAAESMRILDIGCLPVVENNEVIGIITLRDITERTTRHYPPEKVRHIMTTSVISIGPEAPIEEAIELFETHQIRRLPVIQNNQIVGFLTKSDLPQHFFQFPRSFRDSDRSPYQSSP